MPENTVNPGVTTYMELDLKPNYITLRSYWTVYVADSGADLSSFMVLQLFGQKMGYSVPDAIFDDRHN